MGCIVIRPAAALLLLVLIGVAACGSETRSSSSSLPGGGEVHLREAVAGDATTIRVTNTDPLLQPGLGHERWLRIGSEWMQYHMPDVNKDEQEVRVRRSLRGIRAQAHGPSATCRVGAPTEPRDDPWGQK
jgi:hypothetical protein